MSNFTNKVTTGARNLHTKAAVNAGKLVASGFDAHPAAEVATAFALSAKPGAVWAAGLIATSILTGKVQTHCERDAQRKEAAKTDGQGR